MKYLIVGLGNMGLEYDNTRHNLGFEILDDLVTSKDAEFKNDRLGDLAQIKHKGRTLILLKPSTYVNRSGKAVQYWMSKYKIIPANLLVVVDDLNIDFGRLRLREKGNDGGHNGLKDINQTIGSGYARLRLGIGRDFHKGGQVDYVLGKWKEDEKESLKVLKSKAVQAILSFVSIGAKHTMSEFNN